MRNYNYNLEDWLLDEADIPASTGSPDPNMSGNPGMDAFQPQDNQGQYTQQNQNAVSNQASPVEDDQQDNIDDDPQHPDMPEEEEKVSNFETWKNGFFKESIKGNTLKLLEMIHHVRDKDGFNAYQRKFIEDNWNIQLLRQNSNIEKASNEIRRNLKNQIDKHNPATSVVSNIVSVLDTMPMLNNMFIKISGYGGIKADIHRKFIASLIGGVQVGSGAINEDIVYNETDYSILASTRFNSDWGDIYLGNWSLKTTDPERYLSEPELKRMEEGSPEERDVLKRRVILESISNQFKTRSFIINVVGDDGTVYTVGLDLGGCIKSAYVEGRLIVKTSMNEASEGMLTDDGKIVSFMDLDIYYAKETGEQKEDGSPEVKEIPFIQKRGGQLFLTVDVKTIKEASDSLQGLVYKETPYTGNPSDLSTMMRCVYTTSELLLRQC